MSNSYANAFFAAIPIAIRIADEAVRSDIECVCKRVEHDANGVPWYNLLRCPADETEQRIIATAVEYLTLRGRIERHGDLVRVAGFDA